MKPLAFTSSSVRPEEDLLLLQPARQTLRRAETLRERRLYLDTPDQRLREAGQWLVLRDRGTARRDLCFGSDNLEEACVPCPARPSFLWELPAAVAESLRSRIKMRRLSPRLRADLKIQTFQLEDKRQKTVTRLQLVQGRVFRPGSRRGQALADRVVALPLRGYAGPFKRLSARLRSSPILLEISHSIYQEGLELLAVEPAAEPHPPSLAPGLSTHEGIRRVLTYLADLIEANAAELSDPADSEFLHQFRTGVRKTRTLLSQARDVFPKRQCTRFANFFSWLGQKTGSARDTDVHLLKLYGFDSDWPQRFGKQLSSLREDLEEQRRREQVALRRLLQGLRFKRGIHAWRDFLNAPLPPRIPQAGLPLRDFAGRKIWRRFRRIRKAGRRLDTAAAAPLHRLRIHFKKLRYLMEFLAPVFDPARVSVVVSEVKEIQDVLGNFNDCVVQAAWLQQRSQLADPDSPLGRSLDLLGDEVQRESERWRLAFHEHFRGFLSDQNQALLRELFKEPQC